MNANWIHIKPAESELFRNDYHTCNVVYVVILHFTLNLCLEA